MNRTSWRHAKADTVPDPGEIIRRDILLRDASPGPRPGEPEALLEEWSRWESPAERLRRIRPEGRLVPRRQGA
jgi:hypothetical protein